MRTESASPTLGDSIATVLGLEVARESAYGPVSMTVSPVSEVTVIDGPPVPRESISDLRPPLRAEKRDATPPTTSSGRVPEYRSLKPDSGGRTTRQWPEPVERDTWP